MNSLFDTKNTEEVINRIHSLKPDSQPKWGKMSVSQMMAHCIEAMRSAYGETKLKRGLMGVLFGGIAKKSILKEEPFKQGLPTDKNFVIKDDRNFEEEKTRLISYIKKFNADAITKDMHPFFGNLTVQEWDILMSKHLDHHLRQFGV